MVRVVFQVMTYHDRFKERVMRSTLVKTVSQTTNALDEC